MEVEAEAEPLEPVVFVEAGDSGWDLKSCLKTPKSFYLAFFIDRETVAGENRGKCKVCEKDLKVRDSRYTHALQLRRE